MNSLELLGVLLRLFLSELRVAACLFRLDNRGRFSTEDESVIGEAMTGVSRASLRYRAGGPVFDVDVELLDDLRGIVDIPAREAEPVVDDLLSRVSFGVGVGQSEKG